MRPLLSRTTDGRLEIAAAQQVVQKKKKKGGKLGDTIKSDAPWTSPAPLCLCGEFASGMHVRNSGVLERQLSGITPGAWPIPTISKGKRQDALPVWRTGGSLLPRSPPVRVYLLDCGEVFPPWICFSPPAFLFRLAPSPQRRWWRLKYRACLFMRFI